MIRSRTVSFLGGIALSFSLAQAANAQERDDPADSLFNIQRRVAESVSRLPNYLCTQTVERQTFLIDPPPKSNATCDDLIEQVDQSPKEGIIFAVDRLRLDVALSSKTEMYSWVGEGRFDDRDLSEIVNRGTTSTGSFGSFLHAIFATKAAEFGFKGRSEWHGRKVLEYNFEVPITRSGYTVSNNGLSRVTGYSGTFAADAQTFDLLRLEIRTDPLAEELKICRSVTTLEYTKTQMNGLDVLLPSQTTVQMIAAEGRLSHNRTTLTGCHQFMGESKLILDDQPGDNNSSATAKTKTIVFPPNLKVTVELTQAIDPRTAAAGDLITGKLADAIKDKQSGVSIRKGSIVNGRILAITSYYAGDTGLELGLRWDSIEVGGIRQPIALAARSAVSASADLHRQIGRGQLRIQTAADPKEPNVGFFLFPPFQNSPVPKGFETNWTTR